MADVTQKVTIALILKELVSGPSSKVKASLESISKAAKGINSKGGNLLGGALGIGAGFGIAESVRHALASGREAEESAARLSVALGGNVQRMGQINEVAASIAKNTVLDDDNLATAAERLLSRDVDFEKVPKAMQVIADTAAALHLPLDSVADDIAISFGGTVPKALGRAVPALKLLTEEELKAGAALDVLAKAYEGRAAAYALTDAGKEAAALRDIEQAWEDIGKAILPIERTLLPKIAQLMGSFSEPFKPESLVSWGTVFKESIATMIAAAAAGGAAIYEFLIGQPIEWLTLGIDAVDKNIRSVVINLVAFIVEKFRSELRIVASDIDAITGELAKLPGFSKVATNLVARVDNSFNSTQIETWRSEASQKAKVASAAFGAKQARVYGDGTLGASAAAATAGRAYDGTLDAVRSTLGLTVNGATGQEAAAKLKESEEAEKTAHAAAKAAQKYQDIQTQKDTLAAVEKLTVEGSSKTREEVTRADLSELRAKYEAQKITDAQYFEERRRLELGTIDEQADPLRQKAIDLQETIAANDSMEKPSLEEAKQLLALTEQLLPLETKRREVSAQIDADEQKTADAREKAGDQLNKELSSRNLRATATIQGDTFAGRQTTNKAELEDLAIQHAQQLKDLEEQRGTDEQRSLLIQTQTNEVQAKRVEQSRQLADAAIKEGEEAQQQYQARIAENADKARVGQITDQQARVDDNRALEELRAKILAIGGEIKGVVADGVLSDADVQEIIARWEKLHGKIRDGIDTLTEEQRAIGEELQRSATSGLANSLTEIETSAKSAKEALLDMVGSFGKTILNLINQQLAEKLIGGLIGLTDPKGTGGGAGPFGWLAKAIAPSAPTTPTTPPPTAPAAPAEPVAPSTAVFQPTAAQPATGAPTPNPLLPLGSVGGAPVPVTVVGGPSGIPGVSGANPPASGTSPLAAPAGTLGTGAADASVAATKAAEAQKTQIVQQATQSRAQIPAVEAGAVEKAAGMAAKAAQAGQSATTTTVAAETNTRIGAHAAEAGAAVAPSKASTPWVGFALSVAESAAMMALVLGFSALIRRNKGGPIPETVPGTIPGTGPNRDSVLLAATPGERVFSRDDSREHRSVFEAIQAGATPAEVVAIAIAKAGLSGKPGVGGKGGVGTSGRAAAASKGSFAGRVGFRGVGHAFNTGGVVGDRSPENHFTIDSILSPLIQKTVSVANSINQRERTATTSRDVLRSLESRHTSALAEVSSRMIRSSVMSKSSEATTLAAGVGGKGAEGLVGSLNKTVEESHQSSKVQREMMQQSIEASTTAAHHAQSAAEASQRANERPPIAILDPSSLEMGLSHSLQKDGGRLIADLITSSPKVRGAVQQVNRR